MTTARLKAGGFTFRKITGLGGLAAVSLSMLGDLFSTASPGFGVLQVFLLLLGAALLVASLLPVVWGMRILLVAIGVTAALFLAEVGLRLFSGQRYSATLEIDNDYLHRLAPNSQKTYRRLGVNGGQSILVKVNSLGYRGDELSDGVDTRLIVYGDSFIQADFSEIQNTFAKQLEMKLQRVRGGELEVVNAGVNGHGPDQISVRLERELPNLKVDLVIVSIFAGNDFGDLIRNKIYRLDAHGRLIENRFVLSDALRNKFAGARSHLLLYKALQTAMRRTESVAQHALPAGGGSAEEWLSKCRREFENYIGGDNNVDLLHDRYDIDIAVDPDSQSARYKIELMEKVLVRIKQVCDRRGCPLVLLIIPSPIDVCDDYDLGQIDAAFYPAYRRSTLTRVLVEIAARHDIPFIDLFAQFRSRDANELYFHGGNNHWNDAGQELAAEALKDYLLSKRMIK